MAFSSGITWKQQKYIEDLVAKSEVRRLLMIDFLKSHDYKGVEDISKAEASELISILMGSKVETGFGLGTSSYKSQSVPKGSKFTLKELHQQVYKFLEPRVSGLETIVFKVGKFKDVERKETVITDTGSKKYVWVVKIATLLDGGYKKYLLTIRPKLTGKARFNRSELMEMMNSANNLLRKIGSEFEIIVADKILKFERLNLDDGTIDLSNWKVDLPDMTQVNYSEFIKSQNLSSYIALFKEKLPLNFKIIDLTSLTIDRLEEFKKSLSEFGDVSDKVLSTGYTTSIDQDSRKMDFEYVILSDLDQNYVESKEWFMNKSLPFQHIKDLEKFLADENSRTIIYFEMLAKAYPDYLFLRPSNIGFRETSGFLYLNDAKVSKLVEERYEQEYLLEIGYVFSDSHQDFEEKVVRFRKDRIPFFSHRNDILFHDTNKLAEAVVDEGFFGEGASLNIVLSKRISSETAADIVSSFSGLGISVKKIYYVSNYEGRALDGYAFDNSDFSLHPFKFITSRAAFVKQATKLSIYPQLFSTLVELVHGKSDEGINEEDIANILWLTKKRLYRYFQIPSLSLIEPLVVYKNSKDYIGRISTDYFLLRHLI